MNTLFDENGFASNERVYTWESLIYKRERGIIFFQQQRHQLFSMKFYFQSTLRLLLEKKNKQNQTFRSVRRSRKVACLVASAAAGKIVIQTILHFFCFWKERFHFLNISEWIPAEV